MQKSGTPVDVSCATQKVGLGRKQPLATDYFRPKLSLATGLNRQQAATRTATRVDMAPSVIAAAVH